MNKLIANKLYVELDRLFLVKYYCNLYNFISTTNIRTLDLILWEQLYSIKVIVSYYIKETNNEY